MPGSIIHGEGKTSLFRILTTLLKPDADKSLVLSLEALNTPASLKKQSNADDIEQVFVELARGAKRNE